MQCSWLRIGGYASSSLTGLTWGMIQDITDSKNALESLSRHLSQLKSLFEAEFVGHGLVDTADSKSVLPFL